MSTTSFRAAFTKPRPQPEHGRARVESDWVLFRNSITWLLLALAGLFMATNAQGTPQRLTDNAGNILWAADYDAYGRATVKVAASAQLAVTSNLRYPGQYLDAETSLHYNDRRYYDTDSSIQAHDLAQTAGQGLQTKNASSPDGISATSSQINSNLSAYVAGSFQEVIATANSHHQL
jgi:uncharacterized protein RhaS with RHS repeats